MHPEQLVNGQRAFSSYIDGEWTRGGGELEVVDPATAEPFARVSTVGASAIKQALASPGPFLIDLVLEGNVHPERIGNTCGQ